MSRIHDFFLDIKNNLMDYVGHSSNSDFERQVINQLETFGYYETDFQEYMSNQEFGFGVYARKMYENKQKYNPETIINFFQNHRRYDLERQVLEHCQRLQHSD